MNTCPKCKKEVPDNSEFCNYCGAKIKKAVLDEKPKTANNKKIIIAVITAVLAVALVITGIVLGSKRNGNPTIDAPEETTQAPEAKPLGSAVYVKNNNIYFNDLSGKEPICLAENVSEDYYDSKNPYGFNVSPDNKTIIYCESINEKIMHTSDNGYAATALCYRNLEDPTSEPVKIASNVYQYFVSDDFNYVTYHAPTDEKDDFECSLYRYNIKTGETEIIDTDVYGKFITVSNDCTKFIYSKSASELYMKEYGKEAQRIGDTYDCFEPTEDFSTVFYTHNKVLYKQSFGGERVKIADNSWTVKVYNSGECYYTIGDPAIDDSKTTLCYYDGEKSTVITSEYTEYYMAKETPVAIYASEDGKIHVVKKGEKVSDIDSVSPEHLRISDDGKTVGYLSNVEFDDRKCDIYTATITDENFIKPELYDTNVAFSTGTFVEQFWFVNNNDIAYYKNTNANREIFDLYLNKKLIPTADKSYNSNFEENNILLYIDESDTLCRYNADGSIDKIDTGVSQIIELGFEP